MSGHVVRIDELKPYYLRNAVPSRDMAVNGLTTPVEFFKTIDVGTLFILARLCISIHDASPVPGAYGGGSALGNGVEIFFRRANGSEFDLTDGEPIQRNDDFNHFAGVDTEYYIAPGATGDDMVSVRISYNKWTQKGKGITMYPGDSFVMRINDNLTGLDEQTAVIHGTEYDLATYNYHN